MVSLLFFPSSSFAVVHNLFLNIQMGNLVDLCAHSAGIIPRANYVARAGTHVPWVESL